MHWYYLQQYHSRDVIQWKENYVHQKQLCTIRNKSEAKAKGGIGKIGARLQMKRVSELQYVTDHNAFCILPSEQHLVSEAEDCAVKAFYKHWRRLETTLHIFKAGTKRRVTRYLTSSEASFPCSSIHISILSPRPRLLMTTPTTLLWQVPPTKAQSTTSQISSSDILVGESVMRPPLAFTGSSHIGSMPCLKK